MAKLVGTTHENESDGLQPEPGGTAAAPQRARLAAPDTTLTRLGVAMGTAGYMSPEQIRGEKLDARTDIFSFGLVLYETVTGQRAFTGNTAAIIQESILHKDHVPIRDLNPDVMPSLETVINKALQKDREQRYQSTADLKNDLERLRTRVAMRNDRRRWLLWVAAAVLVGVVWLVRSRLTAPSEPHEQQITASPPENPVTGSAISPDGKYIVYHDQSGLYVRAIDSGETRSVSLPSELTSRLFTLCWSPTGGKLLADVGSSDGWDIWVIPLEGNTKPRLLYRNAAEPAISPEGQRVAFVDYGFGRSQKEVWIGDMDGQTPRTLVAFEDDQMVFAPAWSPDGRWVAYGRRWKTAQGAWSSRLEVRPAEGGPAKTLLAESSLPDSNTFELREGSMFAQTWLRDWRLVFSVSQGSLAYQALSKYSLWQLRVEPKTAEATARPQPLAQWWTEFTPLGVSATADGKRLAVLKKRGWSDVYTAMLAKNVASIKPPQRVTLDQRGSNFNSWTANSLILFDSDRNGRREIFRQGPNDTTAETIVSGPLDVLGGLISPNGDWLLYLELNSPGWMPGAVPESLWLMRRATKGGKAEKVTDLSHVELNDYECSKNPTASSPCVLGLMEGKNLILYSLNPLRGKGRQLGKIEVIGRSRYMGWDFSPDGSKVALVDEEKYGPNIEVLKFADGVWHQIALEPGVGHLQKVGWAADGRTFFVTSITPWGHTLLHVTTTGKAQTLWQIVGQGRRIESPFASPDGRFVAFNGETWDSNVWLIDGF